MLIEEISYSKISYAPKDDESQRFLRPETVLVKIKPRVQVQIVFMNKQGSELQNISAGYCLSGKTTNVFSSTKMATSLFIICREIAVESAATRFPDQPLMKLIHQKHFKNIGK